jgi:hypothetical protein
LPECISPRWRSFAQDQAQRLNEKYPPVSPKMCPQPPARSIRSLRRPVTEEPLPALTTIPSP